MYAGCPRNPRGAVPLGCASALLACSGATYVTIGGTAYPCTLVVGGACAASPLAARAYVVAACGAG